MDYQLKLGLCGIKLRIRNNSPLIDNHYVMNNTAFANNTAIIGELLQCNHLQICTCIASNDFKKPSSRFDN